MNFTKFLDYRFKKMEEADPVAPPAGDSTPPPADPAPQEPPADPAPQEPPADPAPQEPPKDEGEGDEGILGGGNTEVKPKEGEGEGDDEEAAEYELSLSEDSPLSDEQLDDLIAVANEHNLSESQAKQLVAKYEEAFLKGTETVVSRFKEENQKQRDMLLADEAFSTQEKARESLDKISNVINHFAGDFKNDLITLLKGPAGNSLPLAKFILNIAEAGGNDTFFKGEADVPDPKTERTNLMKEWYPEHFK